MGASNGQGTGFIPLPEVQEEGAEPQVRAIFADIARTIRVPFVGLFWRVLAAEPRTLREAWEAVAPNLRTWAAERAAAALRDHALIVEAAGISSHKAFKGDLVRAEIDYDLRTRIGNFNALAVYALAKHMLAVTMLSEAFEGRLLPGTSRDGDAAEIPLGVAAGAVPVSPVDPRTVRGRAAELLPEIAAGHGHPTAEDYFRSLARLPDYLSAAWNAIKPVVRDEEYDARGRELVRMATDAVRLFPRPVVFSLDDPLPTHRDARAHLLRLFRDTILPDTLIDAAIIKALTDGPEQALANPYAL